jgi:Mitochondrial import 2
MPSSVVSIDSYFSSDDSSDEDHRIAQQEWEESLEQLAQIVSVVLLPFLGKWLGRRWSYWGERIHFLLLFPLLVA